MRGTRAITLVEILVVVTITAIIAAVLIPVLVNARAKSKQAPCISNLRQIYIAHVTYREDNGGDTAVATRTLVPLASIVGDTRVFRCPVEDRIMPRKDGSFSAVVLDATQIMPNSPFRISYGYVRDYEPAETPEVWRRIADSSQVGIICCPWHGKTSPEAVRSPALGHLEAREGPFLRICGDGHLRMVIPSSKSYLTSWDMFYFPLSIDNVLTDQ